MTAQPYADVRNLLQNLGAIKPGANVRIQEKLIRDTILTPANTALTTQDIFRASNKTNQYQNFAFPDTANGYLFKYARVRHNLQFTVATTGQQNFYVDYFNTFSTINWTVNNIALPLYSVGQLSPTECFTVWNQPTTTPAYETQFKQKIWDWYELEDPIVVGAGDNVSAQFVPASSLTTIAAFTAATTPYTPNSGVQSGSANCYIAIEYTGYMYSEIR